MENLCYLILVSFLLMSVYCSVENSTDIEKSLNKSFTLGDGIQIQNLFVAGSVELFNSRLVAQENYTRNISKTLKAQGEQLQNLTALMTEFVSKKKEEVAITVMACPKDFDEFEDKCYKFHNNRKTWSDASESCQEDGSFLAEPKSELENDFIIGLAPHRRGVIWLGVNYKTKEGELRWASNGDTISGFTNWYGEGSLKSDCCVSVWVNYLKGKWFPDDCTVKHFFVCQTAKVPSLQQTN